MTYHRQQQASSVPAIMSFCTAIQLDFCSVAAAATAQAATAITAIAAMM
jgi:hypothetical protein